MQLDLLFLPLLGGYIFYTKFAFTAYRARRTDRERLIFNSAACGLFALIAAKLLVDVSPSISHNADLVSRQALTAVPTFALVCSYAFMQSSTARIGGPWWRLYRSALSVFEFLVALVLAFEALIIWRVHEQRLTAWFVPSVLAALLVASAAILSSASRRIDLAGALFRTALFGLIAAIGIHLLAPHAQGIEAWWGKFSPVEQSGAPFVAFLLAATLWFPFNLLLPYRSALALLHENNGTDALDAFLHRAAEDKALVQISLNDGKFYVGNVRELPPNPAASNAYVRILPMISGYRDERKELNFTSFYQDVYDDLTELPDFREDWLDVFVKVVPVATIASANRFDPNMFIRFSKDRHRSRKAVAPNSRRRSARGTGPPAASAT